MASAARDVIVVGAGAVGASCAHHLAAAGLRVTVLERFDGPAEGSTGRSFASVRGQWADALNIDIAWRSIQSYRDFPRVHGLDVGYRPTGYLFLCPAEVWESQLAAVELQRSRGVPVDVLDLDEARARTPFEPDGLAGATWGPADGAVDAHGVAAAYLQLARANGATVRFRSEVTGIRAEGDRWCVSVGSEVLRADLLLNCAGGWASELAALAGLTVPVQHSRRSIFASAPRALPMQVPMTIDLGTGVFMRSEGERLLFGGPRPPVHEGYSTAVDWPWMESVLELAEARFPWLLDVPLDRSACWAGTYEVTPDHQAIVGPHPGAPGWYDVCGFSGHGLMQAPEIGRLVAADIAAPGSADLDLAPMSLTRFDDPVAATHVGLVV